MPNVIDLAGHSALYVVILPYHRFPSQPSPYQPQTQPTRSPILHPYSTIPHRTMTVDVVSVFVCIDLYKACRLLLLLVAEQPLTCCHHSVREEGLQGCRKTATKQAILNRKEC